jgi:hypothetical protein
MGTGFERESSLDSPIYERYGIDEFMLTDELGVLIAFPVTVCQSLRQS